MEKDEDTVDYIREVRMILADSIDMLLNLQNDLHDENDEEITQINSPVELVDMSYDLAYSHRIDVAQSEFMKREDKS